MNHTLLHVKNFCHIDDVQGMNFKKKKIKLINMCRKKLQNIPKIQKMYVQFEIKKCIVYWIKWLSSYVWIRMKDDQDVMHTCTCT